MDQQPTQPASTTPPTHLDLLPLSSTRPASVLRNSSFLSLQSIAISVVTPSEAGSDFRWYDEADERRPSDASHDTAATETSAETAGRDTVGKVQRAIGELEVFLHGVADRLKRVSFFSSSGDGSAEREVVVATGKGADIGKLIVDELDAANLVHANIRLMKCLRTKIESLTRLEKELQGLVDEKREETEAERGSSAMERQKTSSPKPDGQTILRRTSTGNFDGSNTITRRTSTDSTQSWNSSKEASLAHLEARLKDAQSRWSDSQEDLLEPIEILRTARKRHLRRNKQDEKLTRRLTRELTKEKTVEKTKIKILPSPVDDKKPNIGRFFKKLF